jgi:hypothetical protein
MGTGPGHSVSVPWNNGLKFKLTKTGQDVPDVKCFTLVNKITLKQYVYHQD